MCYCIPTNHLIPIQSHMARLFFRCRANYFQYKYPCLKNQFRRALYIESNNTLCLKTIWPHETNPSSSKLKNWLLSIFTVVSCLATKTAHEIVQVAVSTQTKKQTNPSTYPIDLHASTRPQQTVRLIRFWLDQCFSR